MKMKMKMKTKNIIKSSSMLLATLLFSLSSVHAQKMPTDPIGGKPAEGSNPSVKDLNYQVKYQRAFEAVLWSMPAVAIYGFHKAAATLGGGDNTVLAWSKPAKPNSELLTANNVTPYLTSQTDLSKGAVVVEIPAATDKVSLYGQIVDHWQITIADVGPSGIDKGKGGKLLLTPPGYKGKVPQGYLEVKSPSYRVAFAFRSVQSETGTPDDAYAYSKTLKMHFLDDPKPTEFIDPSDKRFPSLPRYDETWFEDVYAIINLENSFPRDKVMMGMLASLGIEKGKPYKPDATTKKAMRQAVIDAYYYMADRLIKPTDPNRRWWKDKSWFDGLFSDQNRTFTWETDDLIDLDTRADRYYLGTFYPKEASKLPATQYLFALADEKGKPLEAGKMYSFTMPAKVPVKQFWSLIVYDLETVAFIYSPEERAGLSSHDLPKMKKNDDGSVTLYFGPKAPKGLESNWIPTSGKKPLPVVRMYGGEEAFWDKSWEMPDVKLVK
jgi:hypothetical protein